MRNFTLVALLAAAALTASAAGSPLPTGAKPMPGNKAAFPKTLSERHTGHLKRAKAHRAPARHVLPANPSTDMVTEVNPSAPSEIMTKTGVGFAYTWFGIMSQDSEGSLTEVVRDGDKIYLGNTWSTVPTDGYLVGTVEGNKVTFELPQCIEHVVYDFGDGEVYEWYDYCIASEWGEALDEDGEPYESFIPCESQTVTYTIGDDGVWTADNEEIFLGEFGYDEDYEEYYWDGGGDYLLALTPLTQKATTLPEGVTLEPWTLVYGQLGYKVEIGFEGDKCYLKGIGDMISEDVSSAVIVGTVADGKVTFPGRQYMGESWYYGYTAWFQAGQIEEVYDPDWDEYYSEFVPVDDLVLDYDATAKRMTTDGSFGVSTSKSGDMYFTYWEDFYLVQPASDVVTSVPAPEYVMWWGDDEVSEADFKWATVTEDGVLLDQSKLYFQVLLDGEVFEFYPDEYPGLEEVTDRLPVGFISEDETTYSYGNQQNVALFVQGFDLCEVRLVYVDGDSEVYSPCTVMYGEGGVGSLVAGGTVSHYYDLQGRRVANPSGGLYILATVGSDGTLRHDKVLVK